MSTSLRESGHFVQNHSTILSKCKFPQFGPLFWEKKKRKKEGRKHLRSSCIVKDNCSIQFLYYYVYVHLLCHDVKFISYCVFCILKMFEEPCCRPVLLKVRSQNQQHQYSWELVGMHILGSHPTLPNQNLCRWDQESGF